MHEYTFFSDSEIIFPLSVYCDHGQNLNETGKLSEYGESAVQNGDRKTQGKILYSHLESLETSVEANKRTRETANYIPSYH